MNAIKCDKSSFPVHGGKSVKDVQDCKVANSSFPVHGGKSGSANGVHIEGASSFPVHGGNSVSIFQGAINWEVRSPYMGVIL